MANEYQGKIIVAGSGDHSREMVIFTTFPGGYREEHTEGIEGLLEDVKRIIDTTNYTVSDLQNGAGEVERENCSPYLNCYPPLAPHKFNFLIGELSKHHEKH